jgi:DNA-directed RNA polymerase II subunit RPB1
MDVLKSVEGIQFSLLSPDEIKNYSVCEVTSPDTYENGRPKTNGLYDRRMGVIDAEEICLTCQNKHNKCPGHFGHVVLEKPVFLSNYIKTTKKILDVICFKCSKLCIEYSETNLKKIKEIPPKGRIKFIKDNLLKKNCVSHCGLIQPQLYQESQLKLFYEFKEDESLEKKKTLSPELVLYMFKRISNEDIELLGCHPRWCRPEWMICTVLPVCPPATRPSAKIENMTQRQEDDLTYKYVEIVKFNQLLKKRAGTMTSEKIEPTVALLQYYVATLIDNKQPKINTSLHRASNRPLKGLKQRIEKKVGRIRGNLMGKRVNFSARTVITPNPHIAIDQIGVPIDIAMNLTRPEIVTEYNIHEMYTYLYNGPDKYPGMKTIKKNKNNQISLKYVDTSKIVLEKGDICERHLINGDIILFNRQPTLHKESMMAHRVLVMEGSTFRLNVSATTPYNADFDGDEMNLHVPQSVITHTELETISAVGKLLITPQNGGPSVGIIQDTAIGFYKLTKDTTLVNKKQFMKAMIYNENFNGVLPPPDIKKGGKYLEDMWYGRTIVSNYLPQINLKKFNDHYKEDQKDNFKNTVVEIVNGNIVSGQFDKSIYGQKGNSLIHLIFNDFGSEEAMHFINRTQRIVNNWLLGEGHSIGARDIVTPKKLIPTINSKIDEGVIKVYDKIKLAGNGLFETALGKSIQEHFESIVHSTLDKVRDDISSLILKNLNDKNSYYAMWASGSKGKPENIGQVLGIVGQQSINGKRIPKNFKNRTLPHFPKFDDGPDSRGFIRSSYYKGLNSIEFFFHQMAGREGLIDTAVKTSETGYIQRRLMKALEDIKVYYDYTVRNVNGYILQFLYGDDCINPAFVERQKFKLVMMNDIEIENKFGISETELKQNLNDSTFTKVKKSGNLKELLANEIIEFKSDREFLRKNVFKDDYTSHSIQMPVNIYRLIINTVNSFKNKNKKTNISPFYIKDELSKLFLKLESLFKSNPKFVNICEKKSLQLFKILVKININIKSVILEYKMTKEMFNYIINKIYFKYSQALIEPGEMVGPLCAQCIGEPATQMTLNTFHHAGIGSKGAVTRGVPRMFELLSISKDIKTPSLSIYLTDEYSTNKNKAKQIASNIEFSLLQDIVISTDILFDKEIKKSIIKEDNVFITNYYKYSVDDYIPENLSNWVLRIKLSREKMVDKSFRMYQVAEKIRSSNKNLYVIFSDDNSDNLIIRIRMDIASLTEKETEEFKAMQNLELKVLEQIPIRGITGITNIMIDDYKDYIINDQGGIDTVEKFMLVTNGTNLEVILSIEGVDYTKTFSNDVRETHRVLGLEAARETLLYEYNNVIEGAGASVNYHHLSTLIDNICSRGYLLSIDRFGVNKSDIGPLAKCSFEESTEQIIQASIVGDYDNLEGVSGNIMLGQLPKSGTGMFNILYDENASGIKTDDIEDIFD